MEQSKFQLAKQYEEHIAKLRKDINAFDDCEFLDLRGRDITYEHCPNIHLTRGENPRVFAAIRTALERELAEYIEHFEEI